MTRLGDLPSVSTPIGNAKRVPLQCFLNQVLPPLPPDSDPYALIEEGAFRYAVTKQGKMRGYSNQPPSGIHKKNVNKAYAQLLVGIRSIARTVHTEDALPLLFLNNKEGQADVSLRKHDTLPDAYFVLETSPKVVVEWSNIAAFGEYQREEDTESVQENIKKVVYSMEDCMRMDPRRRFVYAFTIEDTAMKLWYCDRAQVLVSEPFNFVEDYRDLIYFVTVISLARPDQLGWDPTIISRIDGGKRQYDIQVCSADGICTHYRTLESLWSSGARRAMGKGTRVWKAVRIEEDMPTGDPVVVKDAWVDSTRDREGHVHSRVMQSDFLSKDSPPCRQAFTTIQAHGDVWMEDEQDTTLCFHDASVSSGSVEALADREMSGDEDASYAPHPHAAVKNELSFQVHYRVVYGEVGQPLSDVTSLRVIFERLVDTVIGLSAMHKSGWVHRDISLGNILVVDDVAKLSDLEYAIRDTEHKELGHTGTAYFVAVEVEERDYLFAPCPRHMYIPEDDPYRVIIVKEQPEFPFRYNPLHDLESVWWIAVYLIICREIDDDTEQKPWRTDNIAQVQAAHDYFYKRHERKNGFLNDSNFYGRISSLHPRMKKVGFVLDKIRMMLRDTYEEVEKSVGSITFDVATRMYDPFCHLLRAAADVAGDLRIRRFVHAGGSG